MQSIKACRACGSDRLFEFLNLGKQYLSDFRMDDTKPPKHPLVAMFCENCTLVQLKHTTPQSEMYHERYGFKSGINEGIRKDLDDVVGNAFQYVNNPHNWLDIASNDGTLLSFVPEDIYRVGVDPVEFLCVQAEDHADLIVNDYFGNCELPVFDIITSISCFYDMPNPNKFISDVKEHLSKSGVWIIQQNYLLTTMELGAVDNFCHEHLEYYTLKSLESLLNRYDLQVFEVQLSPMNGGSIRTIVAHTGAFQVDESVEAQREKERDYGVSIAQTYVDFASRVGAELTKLNILVRKLYREGNSICILAASTRGATIWQAADLDAKYIMYAVERNPAKVGANFSALGIPIVSEEDFRKQRPAYAIVGPWFFSESIIERESEYLEVGGHLIVPLPEVKII